MINLLLQLERSARCFKAVRSLKIGRVIYTLGAAGIRLRYDGLCCDKGFVLWLKHRGPKEFGRHLSFYVSQQVHHEYHQAKAFQPR